MSGGKANNIDQLVAGKLRMRRVFSGLGQQDLATAANVTVQQIQKYEQATDRISSGRLYTFAKILKVPVNYFFDDTIANIREIQENLLERRPNKPGQVSEAEITKLVKAYTGIDNGKVRKKFMELIKKIANNK